MFRNNEGYTDPTAGSAFAHIAYEERKQRRMAVLKEKRAAETAAAKRRKETEKQHMVHCSNQREASYCKLTWVRTWPKPVVTNRIVFGGNQCR